MTPSCICRSPNMAIAFTPFYIVEPILSGWKTLLFRTSWWRSMGGWGPMQEITKCEQGFPYTYFAFNLLYANGWWTIATLASVSWGGTGGVTILSLFPKSKQSRDVSLGCVDTDSCISKCRSHLQTSLHPCPELSCWNCVLSTGFLEPCKS